MKNLGFYFFILFSCERNEIRKSWKEEIARSEKWRVSHCIHIPLRVSTSFFSILIYLDSALYKGPI